MNTLDFFLMIIFFCAIGVYAYRLRKKRGKKTAGTDAGVPPDTPARGNPHDPRMAPYPQAFPQGMQGFQNLFENPAHSPFHVAPPAMTPQCLTGCRLVSGEFRYNPLPFPDGSDQTDAGKHSGKTADSETARLGDALTAEMQTLAADGHPVTGVYAESFLLGYDTVRILFYITYTDVMGRT